MIDFQTDPSRYRHWKLAFDGGGRDADHGRRPHLRRCWVAMS